MKTTIKYNGEIKEFEDNNAAINYLNSKENDPVITITCNGETKSFGHFCETAEFIKHKAFEEHLADGKELAEEIFLNGATTIEDIRFVLEHKFGLWVARSKQHRYNIREKTNHMYIPFVFAKREMFDLTGKELIRFYDRYIKTVFLK